MSTRAERLFAAYGSVILCTGVASVALLYSTRPAVSEEELAAAFVLAALALAAELLSYSMPKGFYGSIAALPIGAAAVLAPTWVTPLAIAGSIILGQIRARRSLAKSAFNVGQGLVATSVAIAAFSALGGQGLLQFHSESLGRAIMLAGPSALVLYVTLLVANATLSTGAIALLTEQRFAEVWRAITAPIVPLFALSAPAVFALGWLYVVAGVVGAIALAIPMLGMRQLYKTTYELEQQNQELLELMVKAIEARDPYTSGHSKRVSRSARAIAQAHGLGEREIDRVEVAALLHDVGKIHEAFAPILSKPGKLTDAEWELMKTHPAKGADLVNTLSHLRDVVPAIRHHHERWDGKGYPDGLAGERIPLAARIITVADTIDALTTDRTYRDRWTPDLVREEILRCRGTQFDPRICDTVLSRECWDSIVGNERPSVVLTMLGRKRAM